MLSQPLMAAQTSKKKSSSTTRETSSPAAQPSSTTRLYSYISGSNIFGRKGLLFTDTAETPNKGDSSFSGHLLLGEGDDFDQIQIPFGFNYGLDQNIEISASTQFLDQDLDLPNIAGVSLDESRSGLGSITVGGKYRIEPQDRSLPDFALGLDLSFGPLSDDLGDEGIDANIKGLATHTLSNGILLNGGLGILFIGGRDVEVIHPVTGQITKVKDDSDTEIQIHGGIGVPFRPDMTFIAELGIDQLGDENSVLGLGVRGGRNTKYQLILGLGLDDAAPDISIGGGVTFGL